MYYEVVNLLSFSRGYNSTHNLKIVALSYSSSDVLISWEN